MRRSAPTSREQTAEGMAAIVLAAGQSRRMGTQKLLLPFAGTSVIGHIVTQLRQSRIPRILAIVSDAKSAVAAAAFGAGAEITVNPHAQGDMLSSVRIGLRALGNSSKGVLIALGDQPEIQPQIIGWMIATLAEDDGDIIVPMHAGRRGHPLLFSTRYTDEILEKHDGIGLRGLLDAHPDRIRELPVSTPSILKDIDLPQDYRRALARHCPRRARS